MSVFISDVSSDISTDSSQSQEPQSGVKSQPADHQVRQPAWDGKILLTIY